MNTAETAADLHRRLRDALAAGRREFLVPSGTHEVAGDLLPQRVCHISNNDHGPKPILFDLEGARDFVLNGQGATLRCRGNLLPIRVGRGSRVTIRNLVIDWVRPFFTQAEILASEPGSLTFRFDADRYPLESVGGKLVAADGRGWSTDRLWNLLPFDPARREVVGYRENWHLSQSCQTHRVSSDSIRLDAAFVEAYAPGTPIVLMHGNRVAAGIWIEGSEDVTVENVTIHHAPGMGVIAQLSRHVTVERLRVMPSGDRLFSTWVDAVHFADCDGRTRIVNCELRGQFDDAVNLHARFVLVADRTGPHSAILRTVHPQHAGPSPATPGCGWAFYRRNDLTLAEITRVAAVRQTKPEEAEVEFADPLPDEPGELVGGRFDPESSVDVRGCRFGANRGRGVLINLEHRARIFDNHFHVSGRAIESIPDANYWWEGSPVRDLLVRHNTFEDCCFGPCGEDLIYLGPELPDGSDPRGNPLRPTAQEVAPCSRAVLRNIRIEDNVIIRHRGRLLHAHGVDGLVFAGNRVSDSVYYPLNLQTPAICASEGVHNVRIENPCETSATSS